MSIDFFYYDASLDNQTPTVFPCAVFEPRNDAEILKNTLRNSDLDEVTVMNVLCERSNPQRLHIGREYKALYGAELISELKEKLSGNLKKLMIALMRPPAEFLAKEIHHAVSGFGTDEKVLIEILCTATNSQIFAIRDAYEKIYGVTLEEDLIDDTSGSFRRLLVSLIQGRRSERLAVDEDLVQKDINDLIAAGVKLGNNDESTFNAILCIRSYSHLRQILKNYHENVGVTLHKTIEKEFSGDIKAGLLAILNSVENKSAFFAERLHDAMGSITTKNRQLIRIIVSRCEVDMNEIKKAYCKLYGKTLEQDIKENTSGNYKKALIDLIEFEEDE